MKIFSPHLPLGIDEQNLLQKNKEQQTVPQTVDKYGNELSTLAAIFLPYKVVCILFFQKTIFPMYRRLLQPLPVFPYCQFL